MHRDKITALIIPAFNEEEALGNVLENVDRALVDHLIVVDNNSTDNTAKVARDHGAQVIREKRRGYGSACLAGLSAAGNADRVVFMDGDGSDDAREIKLLLDTLADGSTQLVIGSRVLGDAEPGSLTVVQRFGNALTCNLVRLFWGVKHTDLGPFRAITKEALGALDMSDPDFGWTIEMQVKAAQQRLETREIPVTYRVRQAGISKISGNILGSYRAGKRILGYVFAAKLKELWTDGRIHR